MVVNDFKVRASCLEYGVNLSHLLVHQREETACQGLYLPRGRRRDPTRVKVADCIARCRKSAERNFLGGVSGEWSS